MPRKPASDLKELLAANKADALSAMRASKLSSDRSKAMDYYLGDMSGDMPAAAGRSSAVSTDVADTIEGLMPSMVEIFTGSDEVVRFDPVSAEDVQAAEQETDYVNHVFMQNNPGFLVLYGFIKDALLSKVGIVKVWWETWEEEESETYHDLPDDALAMLISDPDVQIVAHTPKDDPSYQPQPGQDPEAPKPQLHDVEVVTTKSYECARVEGVPPEEFGIARNARSLRDCDYCFHEVLKRQEDLIAQGYDKKQIDALPTYVALTNPEELARDTVDEHTGGSGDEGLNKENRLLKITEHYVRMDYEGKGKPGLYRVTTGGDQGDILKRDGKEEIVPEDEIPFAAMTPTIVTHRFFGRSIADAVMDIQRIKTSLIRSILDNAYLAVNPRCEVGEDGASDNTLDDLLVSRPGGIVRTKRIGSIAWQTVPSIAAAIFPVLEYADATREWRTGVTRQGQGIDANALQNQSATAVNQAFSAAQARMKLIARVFAETGIKDLFQLLHGVIRKNGSKAATVRLRNQWVQVDPRDWKQRNDMTVNVGLGTGGKSERLAHVMNLIGMQKEALAGGMTNLVTAENLYNSAKEVVKLLDLKDVDKFFTDPKTQPPPQTPPDPKIIQIQAQTQLEQQKQQTDAAHQQMKTQADIALAERKFQLESELLRQQAMFKEHSHRIDMAAKVVGAASKAHGQNGEGGGQAPDLTPILDALSNLGQPQQKPMRVMRDAQGKISHLAPMQG